MTLLRLQRGSSKDQGRKHGNAKEEKRRTIELRIISAQDLKKPSRLQVVGRRMRAYAVAYVDGQEDQKARTSVDERGGHNPVWNDVLTLSVRETQLRKDSLACLTVDIYSLALFPAFTRDRLVGSVRIFLSDVVKEGGSFNPIQCLAFWVRLPSGDPHGILNVWIPPSGQFLRRHHDSQDFSRILAFPNRAPHLAGHDRPPPVDLHVRRRILSPSDRTSSLPAASAPPPPPPPPHDVSIDTETFTFDF